MDIHWIDLLGFSSADEICVYSGPQPLIDPFCTDVLLQHMPWKIPETFLCSIKLHFLRFGNEKLNLDFVLGKRQKGAAVSLSCGRLSIFFQAERNLGDRTIFHDLMGSSSACCSCRDWMNVNCGTTVKKTFFYLSQVAEENLFRRTRIWITNGTHSRPTQNANIITNRACHYYNWNPFSVRDAFLYQAVVMNNMKFITPPHSLYHTLR